VRVLKLSLSLFGIAVSFVVMMLMLTGGLIAESTKVMFENVKNYELPKCRFSQMLSYFRSYHKPAYH
jgi:hypothetical protein